MKSVLNPVTNVLDVISSIQSYCGNIVSTVSDSINLIGALKKYSALVVKALENLHLIPRSANVGGAIDKVLSYVEEKSTATLKSVVNRIEGVVSYITNMQMYIANSIKDVKEYLENAIKSTIYQYSGFFINSVNSIYTEIAKCKNLINSVVGTISNTVNSLQNAIMVEISNAIDTDKFNISGKVISPVIDQVMSSAFSEIMSPLSKVTGVFDMVTGKINVIENFVNSSIGKICSVPHAILEKIWKSTMV